MNKRELEQFRKSLIHDIIREQLIGAETIDHQLYNDQIDEELCREFRDQIKWEDALRIKKFSEDFLHEIIERYYLRYVVEISTYQQLSEKFMMEHEHELNWHYLCQYQRMSIPFMRRWSNKLRWDLVSQYQKLDDNFVLDYESELVWKWIFRYQWGISGWILARHKDEVSQSLYLFGMSKH